MKEFTIRVLISSAIFGVSTIPFIRGVYYPPLFMVMLGFISAVIGNLITDKMFK